MDITENQMRSAQKMLVVRPSYCLNFLLYRNQLTSFHSIEVYKVLNFLKVIMKKNLELRDYSSTIQNIIIHQIHPLQHCPFRAESTLHIVILLIFVVAIFFGPMTFRMSSFFLWCLVLFFLLFTWQFAFVFFLQLCGLLR